MLEVLEDGERLLPGLPGLRQLAGGAMGVAEVGEGLRLIPAVAESLAMPMRRSVAGGGFGKVAQMVLGVAQAVPGYIPRCWRWPTPAFRASARRQNARACW